MTAPPPPPRPPLGLPSGSVRALLTLLVVAVVIVEVIRRHEVAPLWTETLMIVLAHYFTSRRFINLPPEALQELAARGWLEAESEPLYLPRYTIRILLIVAFVGLAVYLFRENQLFQSQPLSILGVVFSYVLGIMVHGILAWWTKGRQTKALRGWENIKALVVLGALSYTAGAYLLDRADLVPRHLQSITLSLVLFYFGSR